MVVELVAEGTDWLRLTEKSSPSPSSLLSSSFRFSSFLWVQQQYVSVVGTVELGV